MRTRFVAGWLVAVLTAVPGLAAQQVRDSAGIRIIENTRPLLPANRMWRVDPKPILQIGKADGDSLYEFLRVMGIARLSDGRLAVGNQGSSSVRFFDSRGNYLSAAGRAGAGPGEFRQILWLVQLRADSLAVVDLNRVNYYSGSGKFARELARGSNPHPFVYPLGFLSDGSYFGFSGMRFERMAPRAGRWIDSVALYHVGPAATRLDSLDRFPKGLMSYSEIMRGSHPIVFGPRLQLAASANTVYIGFSERYEIGAYSPSGRLESLLRRSAAARPVPKAAITEYRERFGSQPGEDGRPAPPQLRDRFQRLAAELDFAEYLPAYSELLAERNGNLWVRQYETWEDSPRSGLMSTPTFPYVSHWDLFTPRGGWLGRIELPVGFTPLEIGSDYLAGIWRDADDMEFVRLYRLVRP